MGGGKGSTPPAPDYRGAAEQTAEGSAYVTAMQTHANRPNQTTPWGGINYGTKQVVDPGTGKPVTQWTQELSLRPELQSALDTEVEQQKYRSGLARELMGRLSDAYQEYPSYDQFGTIGDMRQKAEDAAYNAQTSRLDPQWADRQNRLEVQLRSQGLQPGMEAYDRAMSAFNRDRTDAYQLATERSVAEGRAETNLSAQLRQQQIAEFLQERGVPLNEVNAIMYGQQVATPQMPGFQSAARAQGPDYLGAAQSTYQSQLDAYNAKQAQGQGFMQGLMNLGTTAGRFYLGAQTGGLGFLA